MRMYDKVCEISLRIVKLKALDGRLPTTNLKKVDVLTEYNNRITGYIGKSH